MLFISMVFPIPEMWKCITLPGAPVDKRPQTWLSMRAVMKSPIVTFEELDREKRLDRARDAERLRNGEITPKALQEENSIFPTDAVITFDLIAHFKKSILRK